MTEELRDDKDWPLVATIERHDPDQGSIARLFKQERFFSPDDYREIVRYHEQRARFAEQVIGEFTP